MTPVAKDHEHALPSNPGLPTKLEHCSGRWRTCMAKCAAPADCVFLMTASCSSAWLWQPEAHLQQPGALSPSLLGCLAVPRRLRCPDRAPMDLSDLGLQRLLQTP